MRDTRMRQDILTCPNNPIGLLDRKSQLSRLSAPVQYDSNNILFCCISIFRIELYIYQFLWLGRESSWLTCLLHCRTRCHTHMSLLMNATHCLGYTLRIIGRLRHPMVQHHCTPPTTEVLARPLQPTPYSIMIWLSLRTLASF